MIRVYYLETERIGNTDTLKGIEYIHDAILGVEDSLRKLIQDTTDGEHAGLIAVAVSRRVATPDEIALLAALPAPAPTLEPAHFSNPSFTITDFPGVEQRVKNIEVFLKALYP